MSRNIRPLAEARQGECDRAGEAERCADDNGGGKAIIPAPEECGDPYQELSAHFNKLILRK